MSETTEPKMPGLTNPFEDEPHGWVQFKGTDICVDIHCPCGFLGHYDGYFCYAIRCMACGQVYELNGHIRLHPVGEDGYHEPKETDRPEHAMPHEPEFTSYDLREATR